ncbi:hypothetical protein [uncultured Umboniibacter sp.]|uniref:hypothetical protein n=1 Tax=uncultured Umboniibacter sp. TaxID=1798917 RepID=UPI002602FCB1|nr:hypothetical protein [uncultured Umboniibacter sp.]
MGHNCRSLLVSFLGSSLLLSSPAQSQSVEVCRTEADDLVRLACYDSLFQPSALTSEVMPAETSEGDAPKLADNHTPEIPVAPAAVTAPPTNSQADATEVVTQPTQSEPKDDQLAATVDETVAARAQEAYDEVIANAQTLIVSDVRRNSRRQVFFATEQGRTFRRESGSYATFKEGDQLLIEAGMMSSMFLVNQDGLRIKVKEL